MSHKTILTRQITYFIHILKLFFHLHCSLQKWFFFAYFYISFIWILFRESWYAILAFVFQVHAWNFVFLSVSRRAASVLGRAELCWMYQVHARHTNVDRRDPKPNATSHSHISRKHIRNSEWRRTLHKMRRDKTEQQKSDSQRKLSARITYLWLSVWNYKYGMNLWLVVSHIAVRRRIRSCVCGSVEMCAPLDFTAPHIRSDFVFSASYKSLVQYARDFFRNDPRQREYVYEKRYVSKINFVLQIFVSTTT